MMSAAWWAYTIISCRLACLVWGLSRLMREASVRSFRKPRPIGHSDLVPTSRQNFPQKLRSQNVTFGGHEHNYFTTKLLVKLRTSNFTHLACQNCSLFSSSISFEFFYRGSQNIFFFHLLFAIIFERISKKLAAYWLLTLQGICS